MGPATLVCVGVVPALVALIVFALVWRLSGIRTAAAPVAVAGMAFAVGVCAGYVALIRVAKLAPAYPNDGWQWLPWLALLASTLVCGAASPRFPRWVVPSIAAFVAILTVAIIVPRWVSLAPQRPVWMAVGAVAICGVWILLDTLWRERVTLSATVAVGLSGTATAAVLALAGSLKFGLLAGLAVSAFGGTVLATRIGRVPTAQRGILLGYCTLVMGILLVGWLYSADSAPPASFLLPALAPAVIGILGHPRVKARTGRWQGPLELTLAAVASGVAVWMAWPTESW